MLSLPQSYNSFNTEVGAVQQFFSRKIGTYLTDYISVSQTVVRGPQVVLVFCLCGPFRLNISQKKDRKNKINVNCVSHTIDENLKQSFEITYNRRL